MTEQNEGTNFFVGFLSLIFCHVLLVGLLWLTVTLANIAILPDGISSLSADLASILLFAVFGVGVTQLLYALPLWIFLRAIGRQDTAKGIVTGVILTLLLNGGCFALMFGGY